MSKGQWSRAATCAKLHCHQTINLETIQNRHGYACNDFGTIKLRDMRQEVICNRNNKLIAAPTFNAIIEKHKLKKDV